jgi:hypothetical protein
MCRSCGNHVPVFRNEYVTLLNVFVPPGKNTGYHIHSGDSVSVSVEDADMTDQNLGSMSKLQRGERGPCHLHTYAKEGPRTHKASRSRLCAGHGQ